jgi:hypothetical protein
VHLAQEFQRIPADQLIAGSKVDHQRILTAVLVNSYNNILQTVHLIFVGKIGVPFFGDAIKL